MLLITDLEQYKNEYIYLCNSIKNNIINNGNFMRILYSTPELTLNGIFISFQLIDVNIIKYYNKYKCIFNYQLNKNVIDKLKQLEINLLNKINTDKIFQLKLLDELNCGFIKLYVTNSNTSSINSNQNVNIINDNNNNNNIISDNNITSFLLKISGIWETDKYVGLTYKFIKL
jgi:hypothetical protein